MNACNRFGEVRAGAVGIGGVLLASCAASSVVRTSTPGDDGAAVIADFDQYVEGEMKRMRAPGLSLSIVSGDRVVLEKGYGYADRKAGRPVTPDTIFNVGSISKLFTNAAIMKLVQAGKVDLDAPITTYIPEFSAMRMRGASIADITVRNMLTHHSGMPSDMGRNFFFGESRPAGYRTAYRALPAELAGTYVATAPGAIFSYSNLSYSLLGIVAERASGMDFARYVDEQVFGPLGMTASSFVLDVMPADRYAKGYKNGKSPVDIPAIRDVPAGQLSSSARDMSRFLSAALRSARGGEGLLEPDTMRQVLTPQNVGVPLDFGFRIGLTWWLMDVPELPGVAVVGHGGDLPPYHALLLIVPERNVGVEINVNNAQGMGSMELEGIAVQAIRTAIRLSRGGDPYRAPAASPVVPLPADVDRSVDGWYSSPAGLMRVRRAGGGLKVTLRGHTLDALCHADGNFSLRYRLAGFIPIAIPSLRTMTFRIEKVGGEPWIVFSAAHVSVGCAQRIVPAPVSPVWMGRVGRYRILNPDSGHGIRGFAIRFDRASGFLTLERRELGSRVSLPIRPSGDAEFLTWGMGRNMNETGVFAAGPDGSETLSFSGFRLRKK